VPAYTQIAIRHWLALCRYRQGEHTQARMLYQAALDQAHERGSMRWVARIQIALAMLDLEGGQIDAARVRLEESHSQTDDSDWEQQARMLQAQARLHLAVGNQAAARLSLRTAIDLFERMGLVSEIQAVRAEHAALIEE
jgi:tetratricopeptide (TPR) repeat protein